MWTLCDQFTGTEHCRLCQCETEDLASAGKQGTEPVKANYNSMYSTLECL